MLLITHLYANHYSVNSITLDFENFYLLQVYIWENTKQLPDGRGSDSCCCVLIWESFYTAAHVAQVGNRHHSFPMFTCVLIFYVYLCNHWTIAEYNCVFFKNMHVPPVHSTATHGRFVNINKIWGKIVDNSYTFIL